MPEAMVKAADMAFQWMLAACGIPRSMFVSDDGTAQREALRRWHQNVVVPITRLLEHELRQRLEVDVRLRHDTYAMDMVSRAQVVDKLVRAGVPTRPRWLPWGSRRTADARAQDQPYHRLDEPLVDVPERSCSCCGRLFQPTVRRRLQA